MRLLLDWKSARFNSQCIPLLLRNHPAIVRYGHRYRNKVRFVSTSREVVTYATSIVTRLKNILFGTGIGLLLSLGYYYITDTRASVHQWLVVPSLRWIYDDAEEAHEVGTKALKALYEFGLHPRERGNADFAGDLEVEVRCFQDVGKCERMQA